MVITYRRPEQLQITLELLAQQTAAPETVLVVDNDPGGSAAEVASSMGCHYMLMGYNAGPAGGLAAGVAAVLDRAGRDDWVLFVDDDDPPSQGHTLAVLLATAATAEAMGVEVAAVGNAGGRFDRRKGLLRRVPDGDLEGMVTVDYLGGNQFPIYRAEALRRAGGPRSQLFFGFDDLELGLRLQSFGYRLVVPGDLWLASRIELGRMGLSPRQASGIRRRARWRRYYSSRNLVWLAKEYGGLVPAVIASVRSALLPAIADVVRERSIGAAVPALRGLVDAWRERLGNVVQPG